MQGDSLIIEVLMRGKCSRKQAEAFQRWLEDTMPVGIGPARLAECISASLVSDACVYVTAMRELQMEIERLNHCMDTLARHDQPTLWP